MNKRAQTGVVITTLMLLLIGVLLFLTGITGTFVGITCTIAQNSSSQPLWLFISCNWGLFLGLIYILAWVIFIRVGGG